MAPAQFSQSSRSKGGRQSSAVAEQTGERLLDAGWELLLQTGFEKFTFDRLARHARTGKATIYARFANRQEFFGAMLDQQIARRTALIEVKTLGSSSPE